MSACHHAHRSTRHRQCGRRHVEGAPGEPALRSGDREGSGLGPRGVVRAGIGSLVLLALAVVCTLGLAPFVREVLDTLAVLGDSASWSGW